VRVVIAEDLALLREGLVALLRENDIEVSAQVEDGPGLLRAIAAHKPDLAIIAVCSPCSRTVASRGDALIGGVMSSVTS
jgi:DNA-binding NarL/FixJ family response regulator